MNERGEGGSCFDGCEQFGERGERNLDLAIESLTMEGKKASGEWHDQRMLRVVCEVEDVCEELWREGRKTIDLQDEGSAWER